MSIYVGFRRLTWQSVDNVCIHVSLVLMVAYAVCIAAHRIDRRAEAKRRLLRLEWLRMGGVVLGDAVHGVRVWWFSMWFDGV